MDNKAKNEIAFFDFDGTLTTKDSLAGFVRFAVGNQTYWSGLIALSPSLLLYKIGAISNHSAKEKLVSYFFKGWNANQFQALANQYSTGHIDKIIRPEAMDKLSWHRRQGHEVVIVSASMESWLEKWCENQSVELLATQLEFHRGKLTGRFATKNCHGIEKVNRIRQSYDLATCRTIYAYGDSPGDKAMLNLADKAFYRCFD